MAKTNIDLAIHRTVAIEGYTQVSAAEFTAWANENGFQVSTGRGRKPLAAVNAFNERHARSGKRKHGKQYILRSGSKPAQTGPVVREFDTKSGKRSKFTATNAAVREWANENGFTVSDRGRIGQDVFNAYGQAHMKTRKPRAKVKADA